MNNSKLTFSTLARIPGLIGEKTCQWCDRLEWHWSFWVVVVFAVLSTVVFWVTDWDIVIMRLFFEPGNEQNSWPLGQIQPWRLLYKSGPLLTLVPLMSSLLILIVSIWYRRLSSWRSAALFIVLCFALGPGLTVNTIFKDHWGRPRPNQIVEFGGKLSYLPPLAPGTPGEGKSFPSGHCSIAFAYGAFFFILRKKSPRMAIGALTGSLVLGGLMGIARMAAGGHFPSDVLWAAYLTLGVAFLLSPLVSETGKTA
ncbi:MAG: phosphatase PAP2 family protein [Deltaproteobacteria bacterium]|nr:phosphatase PAP2 family protein [Deltaproteobacteria bacterium]